MPIKIQDALPAQRVLESENIFVMTNKRAISQDIRPIKIVILNLMPTKIETETQFLRLLGNTPLQVDVELLQTATYVAKNISKEHLTTFYKTFDQIQNQKYDGMIITGAPVELMKFEAIDYWDELCRIMEWSRHHVYSTMHICWGAQAALYYHYQIPKHLLNKKLSGVYSHYVTAPLHPLMRGFDDQFFLPHSRYTETTPENLNKHSDLITLAKSEQAGTAIIAHKNGRQFFITGHFEYDRTTLLSEYLRDLQKQANPPLPQNYFPKNDPSEFPPITWRSTAHLFFSNWLNYYVYQRTPYDLKMLDHI